MPCDDGDTDAAIAATSAALELIPRLSAAQGPPMFFQSGGCCDGSSPICHKDGELPLSPNLSGSCSAVAIRVGGSPARTAL